MSEEAPLQLSELQLDAATERQREQRERAAELIPQAASNEFILTDDKEELLCGDIFCVSADS